MVLVQIQVSRQTEYHRMNFMTLELRALVKRKKPRFNIALIFNLFWLSWQRFFALIY